MTSNQEMSELLSVCPVFANLKIINKNSPINLFFCSIYTIFPPKDVMRKMVRLFRLCAFVLLTMVVTDSLAQGYREGELIVKFRSERAQTRGMAGVEGMGHVETQRLMPFIPFLLSKLILLRIHDGPHLSSQCL